MKVALALNGIPGHVATVAGIAALMLGCAAPAQAQFTLHGKTVTLYVGNGAGGGGDSYARTLIPYLSKNLPGDPPIVVRNMPGGGGIQAVQYLYNVAPADGTAFGTTPPGPLKEPFIGITGQVNYDLRRFRWLGNLATSITACSVWYASPVKTIEDARSREVTIAGTGAQSAPTTTALFLNSLIGTKFNPITGYDGGTSLLAIERGEVDGTCVSIGSLRTTRPNWLAEKKLRVLVQVSTSGDPDFPDAPRVSEFLKTDADRQALDFFAAPDQVQYPYMLPPGVKEDVVATYQKAFDVAVKDPAYLADAKQRRQDIVVHSGADVQRVIETMYKTPKDVIDRVVRAMTPEKK
jgi:tripartite-type tricarboxylate transporter receptor subunit TctC